MTGTSGKKRLIDESIEYGISLSGRRVRIRKSHKYIILKKVNLKIA